MARGPLVRVQWNYKIYSVAEIAEILKINKRYAYDLLKKFDNDVDRVKAYLVEAEIRAKSLSNVFWHPDRPDKKYTRNQLREKLQMNERTLDSRIFKARKSGDWASVFAPVTPPGRRPSTKELTPKEVKVAPKDCKKITKDFHRAEHCRRNRISCKHYSDCQFHRLDFRRHSARYQEDGSCYVQGASWKPTRKAIQLWR